MTGGFTLDDLHREMDRIAKRLEGAKRYRGGTLNAELVDCGARLLDMAAAVRSDYGTFS